MLVTTFAFHNYYLSDCSSAILIQASANMVDFLNRAGGTFFISVTWLSMTVAGQRLAYELFLRDPDANFQYLAGMSPVLTRWLKALDPSSLACLLPATVTLAEHAASHLPEEHEHHELGQELLEKSRLMADIRGWSYWWNIWFFVYTWLIIIFIF